MPTRRMIPMLVCSRNRAAQLDACLSSVATNAQGFDVSVLWTTDGEQWDEGYDRCWDLHPDVLPIRESDFREDVLSWLPKSGYLGFLMDDDLLYRPIPTPPPMGDLLAFSLRLGRQTTECYPHSRPQQTPFLVNAGTHLEWDWRNQPGDWGYVPSLDGHVFHRDIFKAMLMGSDKWDQWHNPNTLEDALCAGVHAFRDDRGFLPMGCFPHSALVNVPANIVTTTHRNRVMDAPAYTPEALNEMYLEGWRIAWDQMDYSGVNAAHAELTYVFEKEVG